MTERRFCAECERRTVMQDKSVRHVFDVRGESIAVSGIVHVCDECGSVFGDDLFDALLGHAYEEYRRRKDLLSPEEIRGIREQYGLSQLLFSKVLGIGQATLQRYEKGSFPSLPLNVLLRRVREYSGLVESLKEAKDRLSAQEYRKVMEAAESVSRRLPATKKPQPVLMVQQLFEMRLAGSPSAENGERSFDMNKFLFVVSSILGKMGEIPLTKLFKLLFLLDVRHFREQGNSVTGICYARSPFGPVPGGKSADLIPLLLEEACIASVRDEELSGGGMVRFIRGVPETVISPLLPSEQKVVGTVCDGFGGLTVNQLSELTLSEAGTDKTTDQPWISYRTA